VLFVELQEPRINCGNYEQKIIFYQYSLCVAFGIENFVDYFLEPPLTTQLFVAVPLHHKKDARRVN